MFAGPTIYLDRNIPPGVYMSHAGHAERSRRTKPPADRRASPAEASRGRRDRRAARPAPAPGLKAPPRAQRGRARGGASRRAAAHLQPSRPAPQGARRVAGAVSTHVDERFNQLDDVLRDLKRKDKEKRDGHGK